MPKIKYGKSNAFTGNCGVITYDVVFEKPFNNVPEVVLNVESVFRYSNLLIQNITNKGFKCYIDSTAGSDSTYTFHWAAFGN